MFTSSRLTRAPCQINSSKPPSFQLNHPWRMPRTREETSAAKSRLSLSLPVENYSDAEEGDPLDGPFNEPQSGLKAQRCHLEVSPTDSAFFSNDHSPESSLTEAFSGSGSGRLGCTPSPEAGGYLPAWKSQIDVSGSPDGFKLSSEVDRLFDACDRELSWESNWSLTGSGFSGAGRKPAVPFIIPLPDIYMQPQIGSR